MYQYNTFVANIITNIMKKLFISAALMIVLSGATLAEPAFDKSRGTITAATQTRFNQDFEAAENVTWEISFEFQKATFTQNGQTITAFYNWSNKLVATTQNVDFIELSPLAIKNLLKQYPDHIISSIIKYDDGHTVYFLNLKKEKADFLVSIEPDAQVRYFKKM
jgi:hypothetical protein